MTLTHPQRALVLLFTLLLLATAPVAAQQSGETTISVPENSPWWVIIAVGAATVVFEIVRRYVNSQLTRKDKEFDARIESLKQEQLAKEQERKRQYELEMARLQGNREADQATANQIGELANVIRMMAESVTLSANSWSQDRERSSKEREEFRRMLEDNNLALEIQGNRLEDNTKELRRLREEVTAVVTQSEQILSNIEALQARIGEAKDERTLMQIIEALAAEVHAAAEAMQRAGQTSAQAVEPTPTLPTGNVSPSNDGIDAPKPD